MASSSQTAEKFVRLGQLSILVKIARLGLGFVSTWLLTRLMSKPDFGIYSIALSASVLMALPGEAGMSQLAIREVARRRVSGDWAGLRGLMHFANTLVASLSIGVVLLALLVLYIFRDRIGGPQAAAVGAILAAVVLGSLANTRTGILRGLGCAVVSQVPEQLVRPGVMILASLGVLAMGWRPLDPKATAWMYVGASAVAFVVGTLLLRREVVRGVPAGTIRSMETSAWLQALVPFTLTAAVQITMGQCTALILRWHRSPEEVASFRVATMLGDQANITVVALGTFIAPRIAELFHEGKMAELQELLRKVSRANLAFGVVIVTGLVVGGRFAVPLVMGDAYADAYLPTCIYAGGQLLGLTLGPVATLANMSGFERVTTISATLGLVLTVLLAVLLCPRYGAAGAAVAAPVAIFLSKGVLSFAVARKTGIRPWAIV